MITTYIKAKHLLQLAYKRGVIIEATSDQQLVYISWWMLDGQLFAIATIRLAYINYEINKLYNDFRLYYACNVLAELYNSLNIRLNEWN